MNSPYADTPAKPHGRHLHYLPQLDGYRAVAVILVLLFHLAIPGANLAGGTVGVTMFFVLSGFLITSILSEEHRAHGTIKKWRFYERRIVRLLPALTILLMAVTAYDVITRDFNDIRHGVLPAAIYIMNFTIVHNNGVDALLSHTWSLAIEEQFYLVWPFIALWLFSGTSRRAIAIGAFGISIPLVLRIFLLATAPHSYVAFFRDNFGTETRVDALVFGALLAMRYRHQPLRALPQMVPIVAGIVLALTAYLVRQDNPVFLTVGFTMVQIGSVLVIWGLVTPSVLSRMLSWNRSFKWANCRIPCISGTCQPLCSFPSG